MKKETKNKKYSKKTVKKKTNNSETTTTEEKYTEAIETVTSDNSNGVMFRLLIKGLIIGNYEKMLSYLGIL